MGKDSPFDNPLIGTIVAEGFARWSPPLLREFGDNAHNGRIGQALVRETDALRIWETHLAPGERVPMHRHVLDYFWIALTDGRVRQHGGDGTSREIAYVRGQTRYFPLPAERYHLHDMRNIGDAPLSYLTIEVKGGANDPIDLPPQR
ncbi:cupin domain-containing protein [Nocardia arthritidis]|uniref:Cupin domain-containing protein n=1 Tax=Nocardia arthritidis TaxID=228602 RepID=A0A6G9YHM9_9NOCA|nr:cupin domain-containing protein [Nocardia arthritidis]QIS12708.1 hypothetical protein F5544_24265 [Nocardia arthritidis]